MGSEVVRFFVSEVEGIVDAGFCEVDEVQGCEVELERAAFGG